MLTDKTKQEFEDYVNSTIRISHNISCNEIELLGEENFYELPFSMQWGVYLEYFDSVGLNPNIYRYSENKWEAYQFDLSDGEFYQTMKKAQQEALKKACEIRNEQLK